MSKTKHKGAYTCEMLERNYTFLIMRDGDSLVVGIDEKYAEIVTAELNTLAAEVARLREALSIIHKCANQLNVIEVARDALNK